MYLFFIIIKRTLAGVASSDPALLRSGKMELAELLVDSVAWCLTSL